MARSNSLIRLAGLFFEQMGAGRPRHSTHPRRSHQFKPTAFGTGLEVLEHRVVLSTTVTGVTPLDGVPFVPPGHEEAAEQLNEDLVADHGGAWSVVDETKICATFTGQVGEKFALAIYSSQSRNDDNLTAQNLLAVVEGTVGASGRLELCIDLADLKNIPGHHHVQADVFQLGNCFTVDDIPKKLATGNTDPAVPEAFRGGKLFDVAFEQGPNDSAKGPK